MSSSIDAPGTLHTIRSDLLNQLLVVYSLFGLLVCLVALSLIAAHGWSVFAAIQLSVGGLLLVLGLARKRLPLELKGHLLVICFTTLGVNSLIDTGMMGRGTLLLILACLIACFALNPRQGQISAVLGVLLLLVIGYLQSNALIPLLVPDSSEWLNQTNWFNTAVFYAFMSASLLIMLSRFQYLSASLLQAEQRNASRLEAAMAEAERANAAKTEFLSRMSHELRTPLNAILGFTELMQIEPRHAGDNRLDSIRVAGEHLLALINEVLDLMGIEEGHLTLSRETVDLEAIFEESKQLMAARAQTGDIGLHSTIEDGPVLLAADPLRIKQVLLNLMSNAVKYNRPGGSVSLTARNVDAQSVEIQVIDTGIGIADTDAAAVFEPFTRFGSLKADVDGTGVGLTISRQLTELMGGRLGFSSELGVGTTFTLTLPRAQR